MNISSCQHISSTEEVIGKSSVGVNANKIFKKYRKPKVVGTFLDHTR